MIEAIRAIVAGDAPVFLLIAGPNGAGKSTFREKRLEPLGFPVIDPDAVGRELFGRHPATREEALSATTEATRRVSSHLQQGRSVGLESVFSDSTGHKLNLLKDARDAGFRTVLVFIGVDAPQISIARVMDRVDHGGHDVPDETIEDRFPRCFKNLRAALAVVDLTILIDNTGCYGPEGESDYGLRHYIFGAIERGGRVEISNPRPRWFGTYGIDKDLGNKQ